MLRVHAIVGLRAVLCHMACQKTLLDYFEKLFHWSSVELKKNLTLDRCVNTDMEKARSLNVSCSKIKEFFHTTAQETNNSVSVIASQHIQNDDDNLVKWPVSTLPASSGKKKDCWFSLVKTCTYVAASWFETTAKPSVFPLYRLLKSGVASKIQKHLNKQQWQKELADLRIIGMWLCSSLPILWLSCVAQSLCRYWDLYAKKMKRSSWDGCLIKKGTF